MLRVLQCIDTLQAGGAERQLCYLAEGLVRHGVEVHVAYFGGGVYEARLRAAGVALHRIDRPTALGQVIDLSRSIRRIRPSVVQTWLGRMNVVGGIASLGRPWIYCERSVRLHDRGLPGAVRQWLGARSTLLVANSETGAELWRTVRPDVKVIPNGLPLEQIAATAPASRASLGVPEDAELILWAGRFVPAKNIGLLGEAVGRVLAARPRAVAMCCGRGELAGALRAQVERHGVAARCFLPGHRDDLWALLQAADLFVLPSRAEGQPNVVLEAMAAGCPLVVSDIGGHRELLDDDSALFFDVASAADAAAAIMRALDDPAAARKRAAAASARVGLRSMDGMVRAYLRLYERLA